MPLKEARQPLGVPPRPPSSTGVGPMSQATLVGSSVLVGQVFDSLTPGFVSRVGLAQGSNPTPVLWRHR